MGTPSASWRSNPRPGTVAGTEREQGSAPRQLPDLGPLRMVPARGELALPEALPAMLLALSRSAQRFWQFHQGELYPGVEAMERDHERRLVQ